MRKKNLVSDVDKIVQLGPYTINLHHLDWGDLICSNPIYDIHGEQIDMDRIDFGDYINKEPIDDDEFPTFDWHFDYEFVKDYNNWVDKVKDHYRRAFEYSKDDLSGIDLKGLNVRVLKSSDRLI